eukprot:1613138-Amphidinium_carterae.2
MAGGCKAAVECAKGIHWSARIRHSRPGRPAPAHMPGEPTVQWLGSTGFALCYGCEWYSLVRDDSSATVWKAHTESSLPWAGQPPLLVGDQEREAIVHQRLSEKICVTPPGVKALTVWCETLDTRSTERIPRRGSALMRVQAKDMIKRAVAARARHVLEPMIGDL